MGRSCHYLFMESDNGVLSIGNLRKRLQNSGLKSDASLVRSVDRFRASLEPFLIDRFRTNRVEKDTKLLGRIHTSRVAEIGLPNQQILKVPKTSLRDAEIILDSGRMTRKQFFHPSPSRLNRSMLQL